jgi:N-acetylmuramoyl-L-alanine amidase
LKNQRTNTGFLTFLAVLGILFSTHALKAQAALGDAAGARPFTVVLDAGHGGHDPGNLGNGFLEKDIALNIVLEAGKALNKNGNVKVVYTRDDDTFVDLYARGEIANKAQADLFVSVHCDSHSSSANGAGTFVLGLHANTQNFEVAKKENSVIYLEDNYESRYADYDINSPESVIGLTIMQEEFLDQSILLGKLMQDRFTAELKRKDRKVKQAGFIVLHQTFMPSVLVETGFLTNRDEGQYLNSKKGQQEMGGAIANAILEYHNQIRSNSTGPSTRTPSSVDSQGENPKAVPDTPQESKKAAEADVVAQNAEVPVEDKTAEALVVSELPIEKKAESSENQAEKLSEKGTEVQAKSPEKLPSSQIPDSPTDVAQDALASGAALKTAVETTSDTSSKENTIQTAGIEAKTPEASGTKAVSDAAQQETKPVAVAVDEKIKPSSAETIEKEVATVATEKSGVLFKVQLMAISKDIPLTPSNFKGLNTLSKEPVNSMYRILYGNTPSYEQAKLLQAGARQKGYEQAYIVAYKDGERIAVDKALKYLSN